MSEETTRALEEAIELCLQLKASLDIHSSSQAQLLIDMLLLELGRQLAQTMGQAWH